MPASAGTGLAVDRQHRIGGEGVIDSELEDDLAVWGSIGIQQRAARIGAWRAEIDCGQGVLIDAAGKGDIATASEHASEGERGDDQAAGSVCWRADGGGSSAGGHGDGCAEDHSVQVRLQQCPASQRETRGGEQGNYYYYYITVIMLHIIYAHMISIVIN